MIIGLTGLKGSGKDTVGAYLVKEHSFERRSFAWALKKSFSALFDIPMHEIEQLKNDDDVSVSVHYGWNDTFSGITSMSFRNALQRYGTESHRDIFGPDFWVDRAFPVDGFYSGRAIVITDCRFENEADRIRELGGFIVRVERPDTTPQDLHTSEVEQLSIIPHYRIVNDRSLDFLYKEIDLMLDQFG